MDWDDLELDARDLLLMLLGDYITKKPYGEKDEYLALGQQLFDAIPTPSGDDKDTYLSSGPS